MSILKRPRKDKGKDEASLVGVYIPTRLFVYLSLYSFAKGESKSSILRTLIEDWGKNAQELQNYEDLYDQIAIKAYKNFKEQKKKNFVIFRNVLRAQLTKAMPVEYVDKIILRFTHEKDKDK